MTNVLDHLVPEAVWIDPDRLGRLHRTLGWAEVQKLLRQGRGDLIALCAQMRLQYAQSDLTGFFRSLRQVRQRADDLGLVQISRCSQDVQNCLEAVDGTALAATWQRLARLIRTATQD